MGLCRPLPTVWSSTVGEDGAGAASGALFPPYTAMASDRADRRIDAVARRGNTLRGLRTG